MPGRPHAEPAKVGEKLQIESTPSRSIGVGRDPERLVQTEDHAVASAGLVAVDAWVYGSKSSDLRALAVPPLCARRFAGLVGDRIVHISDEEAHDHVDRANGSV
jgi:hypothetical protein